jgi:hypothetical protein
MHINEWIAWVKSPEYKEEQRKFDIEIQRQNDIWDNTVYPKLTPQERAIYHLMKTHKSGCILFQKKQ